MKKLWEIAAMVVVLVMTMAVSDCENRTGDTGQNGGAKPEFHIYYQDSDNDGYGNDSQTIKAKSRPDGYSDIPGDCNDHDSAINPEAEEIICNDVDEDCSGDLGSQYTKLYSIDQYDGNMNAYNGVFQSDFDDGISPFYKGFFTFDISKIDWNNVQSAVINAYLIDEPCNNENRFGTVGCNFNFLPDEYYSYLQNCDCTYSPGGQVLCDSSTTDCEYLYTAFNQMQSYFSIFPGFNSSSEFHPWWRESIYHSGTKDIWKSLTKKYISIFPTEGRCVIPNSPGGTYTPNVYSFEDGGNHGGTGNIPYLEVTCQP